MTVYYVDYENVHAGVDGVDKLTANDTVRIFYSPKADTMRIAFVEQALCAQAKIELISVDVGTPNALDFHLVAWLYSELPQATEEHVIVSNDHGYDAADRMGVRLGLPQVRRVSSIAEDLGLPPTPLAETAGKRRSSSRRGGKGRRGTAEAPAVDAPAEAAEAVGNSHVEGVAANGAAAEGSAAGVGTLAGEAPTDAAKAKVTEGSEAAEVVAAAQSAEHVVEAAVSVAGESAPEMPMDSTPASEDAKNGETVARANKRNGKSRQKKKSDKNDKGDKSEKKIASPTEKATEQPAKKASEVPQDAADAPTAADAPVAAEALVAAEPADTATNAERAADPAGEAAPPAVATEPAAAHEPATEPADQPTVEPADEPAAEAAPQVAAAEPPVEAEPQVAAAEPASEPAPEPATEPSSESAPKQTRGRRRRRSAKADAARADAVSKITALLTEHEVVLLEDQLNVVVKAAQAATTKQEFYRGIIQKLGQKQGLVVYGQVKQLFKEISAAVSADTPES